MPLTVIKAKNAKPEDRPLKLSDGGGLYPLVHPAAGKYWRLKYRFHGKEKVLALGTFPEVSLAEAREGRDAARRQLKDGIDPSEAKKATRATKDGGPANSFEAIALEWHARFSPTPWGLVR